MKKYLAYISIAILITSCSVLDKEPYDSIPEQDVWNSVSLSTLYVNNLYSLASPAFPTATKGVSFYNLRLSSLTDETSGTSDLNDFMYGQLTQESVGDFSNDTYSKIRKINILLERVDKGGISDQTEINKLKGQAYFLRAWIYWNLVNLYGGVPMITSTQSMSTSGEITEEILVRRNKTGDCIDTIVRDLDLAAQLLPSSWGDADYGRVTRGAAMALKGRVLLFWASPQFNPLNKVERWQRAYDANKNALDTLTIDGYGLHSSFKELFNEAKEKTAEAIYVRVYDANIAGTYYHGYDNGARPRAEGISGGRTNNPSWQLVQAFPMNNGLPITDGGSGYNSRRYWLNRDPRFKYTIAYNTDTWELSGNAGYRVWTYYYINSQGAQTSTEGNNVATSTGFYSKKFINPSIKKANSNQVGTDWIEIRFAEVLLNLAECANEIDLKPEAVGYIQQIRSRGDVNIPLGNINAAMNTDDLREAIIRERQIELAFENKRFWDLRRRNMFSTDLGAGTPM